jgi:hypothetical protein
VRVPLSSIANRRRYEALPLSLKFPQDPHTPADDIMRYILRGHMLDIREIVRFPAIQEVLESVHNIASDNIPPTITKIAREFLANAADRIEANREGFYHRHQGTWLGLRSCSRSALHLLGMACKCILDASAVDLSAKEMEIKFLPPRWKEAVLLVSKSLGYWAAESLELRRMDDLMKRLIHIYENLT